MTIFELLLSSSCALQGRLPFATTEYRDTHCYCSKAGEGILSGLFEMDTLGYWKI
jgi:hypothetical protein